MLAFSRRHGGPARQPVYKGNFCGYIILWKITYDPVKREKTLRERNLDFEDAASVFDGVTIDAVDNRHDYGEERVVTYGLLELRVVAVVWTERGDARRIISMRKATIREEKAYWQQLGQG